MTGTLIGVLFSLVGMLIVAVIRLRERMARLEQWATDRNHHTKER